MARFDANICAELLYDGDKVLVPKRMGKPAPNQLTGTPAEKVIELAGRVCYDSLGSGRSSAEFAKHVLAVKHLSLLEHVPVEVEISGMSLVAAACVNRPGVHVLPGQPTGTTVISANLRAVMEWDDYPAFGHKTTVGDTLYRAARTLAPMYFTKDVDPLKLAKPVDEQHQWVTLFIGCSRGCSHELVRHGDRTAISQRSTRYCDESSSPWVIHPLMSSYAADADVSADEVLDDLSPARADIADDARMCYSDIADRLEAWLVDRGTHKLTARKQARGAARGYLGNALYTELVFSASVAQWKHILNMRLSDPADAEIRVLAISILRALQGSRYGNQFEAVTRRSDDRIGDVLGDPFGVSR
jgi:flavin-dependent thymidylate synthase